MWTKSRERDCRSEKSRKKGMDKKLREKEKDNAFAKVHKAISDLLDGLGWRRIESPGKRNYRTHQWRRSEVLLELFKMAGIVIVLSYFFYRSVWAVIPLTGVGILYLKNRSDELAKQGRRKLNMQFKECIMSAAASMRAGYAVENAFLESRKDMELLYGEHSFIYEELEMIRRGLVMNVTLEELLWDFGARSSCDEIREFAEVFAIAKRSGGNIAQVIQACAEVIGMRVDTEEEIVLMISSRRMEQRIMNLMPFGILLYVEFSNKGYFSGLYHNLYGVGIMSVCLAVYLAAYRLAEHILGRASAFG